MHLGDRTCMVNTRNREQLTEQRLRVLIERSPALAELIQLSDKCGPQGRVELLRIIHQRVQEGERASERVRVARSLPGTHQKIPRRRSRR